MERGITQGFVDCAHDMEANARKSMDPTFLVSFYMESQALVYSFIGPFANSIGLGMELEEALHLNPVIIVRFFQEADIKSLSLSNTISRGRPFSQYQQSKNRISSCFAEREVVVGMIRISEPRQSVMVRIQLCPLSSGSGPMKSIEID